MIKIRYKIKLFFIFKQVVCYAINTFLKIYFEKLSVVQQLPLLVAVFFNSKVQPS